MYYYFECVLQKYSSANLYFVTNRFKIKFQSRNIQKKFEIKKKIFLLKLGKGGTSLTFLKNRFFDAKKDIFYAKSKFKV